MTFGNATVTEVLSTYDGDTFYASIDEWPPLIGYNIEIRAAGVDVPEIHGQCDREKSLARLAMSLTSGSIAGAAAAGRKVELRNIRRDKEFRIVADVYIGNRNLADSLIDSGLGFPHKGGTKRSWCTDDLPEQTMSYVRFVEGDTEEWIQVTEQEK